VGGGFALAQQWSQDLGAVVVAVGPGDLAGGGVSAAFALAAGAALGDDPAGERVAGDSVGEVARLSARAGRGVLMLSLDSRGGNPVKIGVSGGQRSLL
jgi:hypothetical protein